MKWPFVSRLAYDALASMYETQRREWVAERTNLIDRLATMQRQGFRSPEPSPPPLPSQPSIPARIRAQLSTAPKGAQAALIASIPAWIAGGMTEEAIVKRIAYGEEPRNGTQPD